MEKMTLKESDKAEITVLVDNYCDLFLPDTDGVKRMRVVPPGAPMAEPGLSYLIKLYAGSRSSTLLFDTGISGACLLHNAKTLASSKAVLIGEVTAKLEEVEAALQPLLLILSCYQERSKEQLILKKACPGQRQKSMIAGYRICFTMIRGSPST